MTLENHTFPATVLKRASRFRLQSLGALLPILLGAAVLAGCGSREPFEYVEVSGKVCYEDGSLIPAERINVKFLPQAEPVDPKTHPRPGMAEVNVADGTFDVVTSHRYGDGIVLGKHKVLVTALDKQEMPSDAVPPEYRDAARTPLEVDSKDAPFDFKVRKP